METKIRRNKKGTSYKVVDVYIIRYISEDGLIKIPKGEREFCDYETKEDALKEIARLELNNAIILTKGSLQYIYDNS